MGMVPSRLRSSSDNGSSDSSSNDKTDTPRYHNMRDIVKDIHKDSTDVLKKSDEELKQMVNQGIYLLAEKPKSTYFWMSQRRSIGWMLKGATASCYCLEVWTSAGVTTPDSGPGTKIQAPDPKISGAGDKFEVALLKNVCWLEIKGSLKCSHLTPKVPYQVVIEYKLEERSYGWNSPVSLELSKSPGGQVGPKQQVKLKKGEAREWLQLVVGQVTAQREDDKATLQVCLSEYGGHWKKGLRLKGVQIIPNS
ncbi:hypothetical protein ACP4OV_020442 [Aristida adscensionis]